MGCRVLIFHGCHEVHDMYVSRVNGTLCVMKVIYLNDGCSSTCFGIAAINHNKTNCIYPYEDFFRCFTSKGISIFVESFIVVAVQLYFIE